MGGSDSEWGKKHPPALVIESGSAGGLLESVWREDGSNQLYCFCAPSRGSARKPLEEDVGRGRGIIGGWGSGEVDNKGGATKTDLQATR